MAQASHLRLIAAVLALCALASPARADLKLCNRLSYVAEAAIGIEDRTGAATRGWFRIEPGTCRAVIQLPILPDHVYVHVRVPPVYGPSPLPLAGNDDLCIGDDDFVIPGARACAKPDQHLARFIEVRPSDTPDGQMAVIAENPDYSDEQARRAGIQRLLGIAGYDAGPIDGEANPKTEAALAKFIADRGLPADSAKSETLFDLLIDAAEKPAEAGLSWCNDTTYPVMAAFGVTEKSVIITRGWYRIEPGKCLRPDISGHPAKVFSFATAVDADGRTVQRDGKPLSWGGGTVLCTHPTTFELADQTNCAGRGLLATGFAAIDLAPGASAIVRFKP